MLAGNGNHQAVDLVLLLQFGLVQVIIIRFALTCSALQSFSYIMNGHIAIPCQPEIGNVVLINLHASRDHGGRG